MQLRLAFALATLALFAPIGPSKGGVPKKVPKPSPHKTPSGTVDWNRTLAQPDGEAARAWISPRLYYQRTKVSGVSTVREASIVVINPDLKKRVQVRVRCYDGAPKPVFDATRRVDPVDTEFIAIAMAEGFSSRVGFFCHVSASKPVFAYASTHYTRIKGTQTTKEESRPYIRLFRA